MYDCYTTTRHLLLSQLFRRVIADCNKKFPLCIYEILLTKLAMHLQYMEKKLQLPVWYFCIFSQIINAARLQFKTFHPFQEAV